jgi:hypothetical protein
LESIGVTISAITIVPLVEGFQLQVATFADVVREMQPGILLLFARKVTLLAVLVVAVRVVVVLNTGVEDIVTDAVPRNAHFKMMTPAAPLVPIARATLPVPLPPPAPPPPRFATAEVGATMVVPPSEAPDPPVASVEVLKFPPAPPEP